MIGLRLRLLNEYISENKFDLTLLIKDKNSITEILSALKRLNSGYSNILLNLFVDKKVVDIKVRENVKLSMDFIDTISNINGIETINYS